MRFEEGLPLCVVPAAQRIVVPGGPVGFEHQPLRRPPEIRDHYAATERKGHVDLWGFKSSRFDYIEHHLLKL